MLGIRVCYPRPPPQNQIYVQQHRQAPDFRYRSPGFGRRRYLRQVWETDSLGATLVADTAAHGLDLKGFAKAWGDAVRTQHNKHTDTAACEDLLESRAHHYYCGHEFEQNRAAALALFIRFLLSFLVVLTWVLFGPPTSDRHQAASVTFTLYIVICVACILFGQSDYEDGRECRLLC
jgi:hypothetical protein